MSRRPGFPSVRLFVLCLNLAVFLFALALTGCSSSKPKKRGVKLSEASEQAKKKPEDQEPLRKKKKKGEKDEPIVHDDDDDDDSGIGIGIIGFDSDGSDAYDDEDLRPPSEDERLHVGVVVGGGSLGKNELDGFALFGIQIGPDFFEKRLRVDLRGLVMPTNQTEKAQATSGLDDELEIAGDIGGRYYFTPAHTFMGLYTHLGLRVGHLSWDYKNPIVFIGTGGQTETIDSDGVNFFAVFGGFGVALVQLRKVHIGANVSFGYKSYSNTTSEGFDNDVFPDEPFTQLMLEFTGLIDGL